MTRGGNYQNLLRPFPPASFQKALSMDADVDQHEIVEIVSRKNIACDLPRSEYAKLPSGNFKCGCCFAYLWKVVSIVSHSKSLFLSILKKNDFPSREQHWKKSLQHKHHKAEFPQVNKFGILLLKNWSYQNLECQGTGNTYSHFR